MDPGGTVIVALNVVLALACGWPLTGLFSRLWARPRRRVFTLAALLAVYFAESAAFAASMGTDLFSLGLAGVWGLLLGRRRTRVSIPQAEWRRLVRLAALYTSLPAVSFLALPIVCALGGWPVLDAAAGGRFGIPSFLPWPLDTILGFCVLVAGAAVAGKLVVTTAVAAWFSRRRRPS